MRLLTAAISTVVLSLPLFVSAQSGARGAAAVQDIIGRVVTYIIDPMILLVFAAGFFLFVWGLVQFIWNLNEGVQNSGKQHMMWGIVGMLIMVSVYGIISLIDETFNLDISNPDISRINNVTMPANFFGQ